MDTYDPPWRVSTARQRRLRPWRAPGATAPQGAPCRHTDGTPRTEYGRPMICPDRRRAWQMLRDGEIRRQED